MIEINTELAEQGYCASLDTEDGSPCMNEAGEGIAATIYQGRCIEHTRRGSGTGSPDPESMAGNQRAVGNDGGPPPGSQNALKHGMYANLDLLDANLDGDAREWVDKHTADLAVDWERETGHAPSKRFRRERLRPIALMRLVQTQGLVDMTEHGLVTTVERTETFVDDDGEQREGVAEVEIPRRTGRETFRLSRRINDALGDLGLLLGVANEPDPADDPWVTSSYEIVFDSDSEDDAADTADEYEVIASADNDRL